ncbi:LysR family transcriptional regulator [Pseudonocardia hispaniensis]|uniref:LysR family transcriptional regulator n=1 Tax=Pseudonocardia hispaniensis TaxID=904933 RepID=A0ABW1J336_9PSEU
MPQLPDIESLRLLVLVGERGSLTAAAAELEISQPSASKRLSSLERRLGLKLLERSRRGSTLTPAGTLVCGWAQRILDEVGALLDGVSALRQEQAANLRVAASMTIAEYLLPAWIGDLRRSAPELHVGLQVLNSARVCELARQGVIDIGFVESPRELTGLRSRLIGRDRLVLVVAPGHRWARRRRPVGPAELASTPVISREAGSGTRETAERAVAAAGATMAPPLLELGSSTAIRNAVAAGVGPALISEVAVAAELAAGSLVEVPTEGLDLGRSLRAVWSASTRASGPAAGLLARARRRGGDRGR